MHQGGRRGRHQDAMSVTYVSSRGRQWSGASGVLDPLLERVIEERFNPRLGLSACLAC